MGSEPSGQVFCKPEPWPCVQLWRKYLTNTKVSFVENDVECAKRHKADIEAVAKGKVYVGKAHVCNTAESLAFTSQLTGVCISQEVPETCICKLSSHEQPDVKTLARASRNVQLCSCNAHCDVPGAPLADAGTLYLKAKGLQTQGGLQTTSIHFSEERRSAKHLT